MVKVDIISFLEENTPKVTEDLAMKALAKSATLSRVFLLGYHFSKEKKQGGFIVKDIASRINQSDNFARMYVERLVALGLIAKGNSQAKAKNYCADKDKIHYRPYVKIAMETIEGGKADGDN